MIIDTKKLKEIAEIEFGDIVEDVLIIDINELRIVLINGSYVDIWFSLKLKGRYSYHDHTWSDFRSKHFWVIFYPWTYGTQNKRCGLSRIFQC